MGSPMIANPIVCVMLQFDRVLSVYLFSSSIMAVWTMVVWVMVVWSMVVSAMVVWVMVAWTMVCNVFPMSST